MKKSIDISANYWSSEVPKDNSVYVDHWDDSKDYFLSESMSFGRAYESKKSIHHPATLCFTRMKPTNSHAGCFAFILVGISNMQNGYSESSGWVILIIDIHNLRVFFLQGPDCMHQIRVWIRNTISKINIAVLFAKLICPRKAFLYDGFIFFTIPEIFIGIWHIFTTLLPNFLGGPKTIWSHALVVEKSTFLEIN